MARGRQERLNRLTRANITSETEASVLKTGPPRRHQGEVDGEGMGWHQDASKESEDSCNRATGTKHGKRELTT